MLFGVKLANEIYPPWKESYLDYEKLKKLLKESIIRDSELKRSKRKDGKDRDKFWTEKDESLFVSALDEELEKVYSFQTKAYDKVMKQLNRLEDETEDEAAIHNIDFEAFHQQLEECLSEAQELDNFQRLNFTGFTKIVKKHDKLHPGYPSVKSLLQVRLKALPFHSEEYSPLLYKISYLYNILRMNFASVSKSLANSSKLSSLPNHEETTFQTFKFWVHNENLMEVKTRILRRLPVLVYAQVPSENDDLINRLESNLLNDDGGPAMSSSSNETEDGHINKSLEPYICSLYFDNEFFELYNNKLLKTNQAPTLRLRWVGKLAEKPDIFLEKRMFVDKGDSLSSEFEETRIKLKSKHISGFIFNGDSDIKENTLKKLKESVHTESQLGKIESDFDSIQKFVMENELQPVLRTLYTRTAFQIPGDDTVRITIDSDITFIREDSFDKDRPIRDPKSWHRTDIDSDVNNPMKFVRPGELAKFPHSVMEIKVKTSAAQAATSESALSNVQINGRQSRWISELTNSHLVKEVPKFSKYIQGVASLFSEDDKLDMLPFWLPDLEYDIRKDPKQAYEEEKKKLERQKEHTAKMDKMKRLSIVATGGMGGTVETPSTTTAKLSSSTQLITEPQEEESSDEEQDEENRLRLASKRKHVAPNIFDLFTGRDSKLSGIDSEDEEIDLPPGVKKPTSYIKNAGPVKVEAKVWLANERTFNRWLSVTTMLSVLTFSIFNSVNRARYQNLAEILAYIYFALTLFTGLYAYRSYLRRLNVIKERSGQHLDSPFGPLFVALIVSITLLVNFVLAFREAAQEMHSNQLGDVISPVLKPIQEYIFDLVC